MKNSILRNTLSLALCAALMFTLLPVTALAADGTISAGGDYDLSAYGSGSVITINTTQAVTLMGDPDVTYTNMQINCSAAGVSLTLSNVNINNSSGCALAFTGGGNALALEGSSTLTSGTGSPGVRVANGTELTISDGALAGTGQLTAHGGYIGAGIGGGPVESGGTVTINGGTVTVTGMDGGAGIGGGSNGNGGTVTITGGTVTATGVNGGAGIGGGRERDGGTVTITGGTVMATGGEYSAGIGGGEDGDGGSVAISGGTVTAAAGGATNGTSGHAIGGGGFYGSSGSIGAPGTCVITGGTVKAETGGMGPVPTNGSAQVYLTTVTLNGAGIAAVSALTTETAGYTYGINDMKTDASGKLYLYLPVSTNTTAAETATTHYGKSTITTSSSTPASGTLWPPAFSVTGGTANYTYGDDGVLTFTQNGTYTVAMAGGLTQTTTDRIVVASGVTANITLSGVDIDVSSINQCAFDMTGATVYLTLAGTNSLKSSGPYAGLRCPDGAVLTIGGTGSLTAEKKYIDSTNQYGAGIGGGQNESGGNITINGGSVIAISNDMGAGIGGGTGGDGGTVTITGGTVTASSNFGGAGIGGGMDDDGGTVEISGGTVTATGGYGGAGIGGGTGGDGGTVTINGGSVKATGGGGAGIGGGGSITSINSGGGTLYISGGSVNTTEGSSLSGTPAVPVRSSTVNTPVYLTTVTLGSVSAETAVSSLTTNAGYTYGIKDMKSDASGKLYLYLPESTNTTAARTAFVRYAGYVATTTNSITSLGTLSPDAAAPAVSAVDPNSTGAAVSGNIAITFSEEMRTGAGTVSLDGGATNLAAGSWNADKTVYTVSYSGLAYAAQYTVKISGFADYSGNVMADDSSHSFTTLAAYSSTTYYTITAAAGEGGSISPSGSASVAYGNDKTYAITADEGYVIEAVLADGVSVGAVSSYTFENVKKAHTITASFKKAERVNPFTDVNENDWFYNNVLYAYENGLMTGTASDVFSPGGTMTRAMAVTVLHRLSGDTGSHTNNFADVASGAWYEQAAAWAAANGIANGAGGNQFSPESAISREQLAVMLYNYAKYKGYDVSVGEDTNILSYNDAFDISDYAYSALQWACGAGIMNGDDAGNLNPQGSATRTEVAAMLQRFIENVTG